MLHKLFPQLSDYLRTAVPGLGTIDLDMAQLDYENQEPIAYPAVYIDLENVAWKDLTAGIQTGQALLRFTVAVEVSEESYQGAAGRPAMLERLQIVQDVHHALQHHQGEGFGPMVRSSYRRDRPQHPEAWCLAMGYVTELLDNNGAQAHGVVSNAEVTVTRGRRTVLVEDEGGYVLPVV